MYNVGRIIIFMFPNTKAFSFPKPWPPAFCDYSAFALKTKITNIYLIHILYI